MPSKLIRGRYKSMEAWEWGGFSPFFSRTFPQTLVLSLLTLQTERSSGELPSSFDPTCTTHIPSAAHAVCPVAVPTSRLAALWGVLQFSHSGMSEVNMGFIQSRHPKAHSDHPASFWTCWSEMHRMKDEERCVIHPWGGEGRVWHAQGSMGAEKEWALWLWGMAPLHPHDGGHTGLYSALHSSAFALLEAFCSFHLMSSPHSWAISQTTGLDAQLVVEVNLSRSEVQFS